MRERYADADEESHRGGSVGERSPSHGRTIPPAQVEPSKGDGKEGEGSSQLGGSRDKDNSQKGNSFGSPMFRAFFKELKENPSAKEEMAKLLTDVTPRTKPTVLALADDTNCAESNGGEGDDRADDVYLPEDAFSLLALAYADPSESKLKRDERLSVTRAAGAPGEGGPPAEDPESDGASKKELRRARKAFLLGRLAAAVQASTLAMLWWDTFANSPDVDWSHWMGSNWMGLPGFTPPPVRVCQILAITIAVLSQEDTIWAINVFLNGRAKDVQPFDGYRRWHNTWWYLSNIFRGIIGIASLAITFVMIMRSGHVRDLLLNFTAVEFISNVDNMVYTLAAWNYFGKEIKDFTDQWSGKNKPNQGINVISEDDFSTNGPTIESLVGFCHRRSVDSDENNSQNTAGDSADADDQDTSVGSRKYKTILRRKFKTLLKQGLKTPVKLIILLLLLQTFFGLWVLYSVNQGSGAYLPQKLYVQFGDDEIFKLGFASGVYKLQGEGKKFTLNLLRVKEYLLAIFAKTDRVIYATEEVDGKLSAFKFCGAKNFWGFVQAISNESLGNIEICDEFVVKSSVIQFNIPSSSDMDWSAQDGHHSVPMAHMRIIELDEGADDVTNADYYAGKGCLIGQELESELVGCWAVEVEATYVKGQAARPHYQLIEGATSYNRPVYARRTKHGIALMMSVGRRWTHLFAISGYHLPDEWLRLNSEKAIEISGTMEYNPNDGSIAPLVPKDVNKKWYTEAVSFIPFKDDEKRSIKLLARFHEEVFKTKPDWFLDQAYDYVDFGNPARDLNFSAPTLFSDTFDVALPSDRTSPSGLSLFKSFNYPSKPDSQCHFRDFPGAREKRPFSATAELISFSKCEDESYVFLSIPGCNVDRPEWIGGKYCSGKEYNREECLWDGGACDKFNNLYEECKDGSMCRKFKNNYPGCDVTDTTINDTTQIGNGWCDEEYNTLECKWDGGDCIVKKYHESTMLIEPMEGDQIVGFPNEPDPKKEEESQPPNVLLAADEAQDAADTIVQVLLVMSAGPTASPSNGPSTEIKDNAGETKIFDEDIVPESIGAGMIVEGSTMPIEPMEGDQAVGSLNEPKPMKEEESELPNPVLAADEAQVAAETVAQAALVMSAGPTATPSNALSTQIKEKEELMI